MNLKKGTGTTREYGGHNGHNKGRNHHKVGAVAEGRVSVAIRSFVRIGCVGMAEGSAVQACLI
jgi:hypothetical protein